MKLRISQGGKQVDLNSLFSDESVSCSVPLYSTATHNKAMDKIHSLVCVRERCCKEIIERLQSDGFEEEDAKEATACAVRCGLIDEERYASALIRGKVHAGWGKEKIIQRLMDDGIGWDVISACSQFFATPEEEYERALIELEKRSTSSKNPRATLTRRLLQKGYSQEVTRRAVNEFMARGA